MQRKYFIEIKILIIVERHFTVDERHFKPV